MYEKIKYPDGSSYVKVSRYEKEFTFRVNSYEDLWTLSQLIDVYNNAGLAPTITIPCLIDAQADRRFNDNESFGLKLVVKFLSGLNADFKVFHPHSADALEFGADNIEVINNNQFLIKVLYELDGGCSGLNTKITDNLIIMSPDAGMYKSLMKSCDKIKWTGETYSASKSRKYEDGKSKLVQQVDREDFNGKDILIVDDLMIGGSTFVGLAKMLKERNCGKLYIAVSHITVESPNPEIWKLFDRVFTTNSKGIDYTVVVGKYDKYGKRPENLSIIELF